ncbi:MAG: hypothetical protein JXA82_07145 [Sedimentisphaerales bacterium]|nr:hypothetical protein [Sedimentisphaerales bacterium]
MATVKKSFIFGLALTVGICISVLIGCNPEPDGPDNGIKRPGGSFTLFFTGQSLSTLKPCGCSEDQLGGLERRPAILNTIPRENRLVIETGNLLRQDSAQDRIKLNTFFQALNLLGYDLVCLDSEDFRVAQSEGLLPDNHFSLITSAQHTSDLPPVWSSEVPLGQGTLRIVIGTVSRDFLTDEKNEDGLLPIFGFEPNSDEELRILIIEDCLQLDVSQLSIVDLIVCPGIAAEAEILSRSSQGPLVVSVGKLGEYIGKLTVRFTTKNPMQLDYEGVPVSSTLPTDEQLVDLYEFYKLRVKEENLLEKVPKLPLPEGLEYTGSDSCAVCHKYEYEKWSTKAHAKAYQTLVEINQQYDPECIRCHVVGFQFQSGFANENSPPDLRNVGCEVCHGPSSQHIASQLSGGKNVAPGEPKFRCIDCHTPENSINYAGHEAEYMEKIVHWREPKAD